MFKIDDEVLIISTGLKGRIIDIGVDVNRTYIAITMCKVYIYGNGETVCVPSCSLRPYVKYDKKVNPYNKSLFSSLIKDVIFNAPATIVLWEDGTKTVVKCGKNDVYDPEKGLAMAIAKRALGNKGSYYETFKKYINRKEEDYTYEV